MTYLENLESWMFSAPLDQLRRLRDSASARFDSYERVDERAVALENILFYERLIDSRK